MTFFLTYRGCFRRSCSERSAKHACMRVCVCVYINVCVCVSVCVRLCVSVYMCVCLCLRVSVCVYIFVRRVCVRSFLHQKPNDSLVMLHLKPSINRTYTHNRQINPHRQHQKKHPGTRQVCPCKRVFAPPTLRRPRCVQQADAALRGDERRPLIGCPCKDSEPS